MIGLLSYQIWMSFTPEIRSKLVTLFSIPRSGYTTVEYRAAGNVVTSDGHTPDDLRAISLERLQEVLNSKSTNYYELLETVVPNLGSLLGGTFSEEEGLHIPHPTQPPEKRVTTNPWLDFLKEQRALGKTMKEAAALYKERHGK